MSFRFSPRPNRAHEIRWREWGSEAFAEARDRDMPVLLGISGIWCHWCHVMDETTYSDPEVIRLVNERYVPIRVDNDERPDVNRRYNLGGWPTTAFLTPDGEIIHGGTYVPPEAMRGLAGQISDLWRVKKDDLTARVAELRAKEREEEAPAPGDLAWDVVDQVASLVRGQYDPKFGGFGREPKFPQPALLRLLLAEHRRHGYPDVAAMLHKTLGAMAAGGTYDPVEGGFFRYSTTRDWSVPHFEKMLEDNSELLSVYAEAHRTFPEAGYDRVARDVIRWMDAVLWRDDVKAFAGSQDADEHYYALDAAERAKHERPFVDRTIYTGWNALAASAYVAAFRALGDRALDARAHDTVHTISTRLHRRDPRVVFHFDRGDGPQVPDLLADLAALLAAAIDAYETGLHPVGLGFAEALAEHLCARLEDGEGGGFFDAPERDEPGRVSRREKPIEDNALAADALLRLAALTGEARWRTAAERALRLFVGDHRRWGQFAAAYAEAVARALTAPLVAVVVGPADDRLTASLWERALAADDPARSLHRLVPGRDAAILERLGYPGRTAAYVCVGTVCSAPLEDAAALDGELARARARHERS
ncbi:MAG TPA: DUF255 domain-containing protein [Candidatus Limnocylindria bacterium]|nr:DUF255 domain-containing protein [Candidatus Limnocylindria bacterium]